jgi:hypothetical protein
MQNQHSSITTIQNTNGTATSFVRVHASSNVCVKSEFVDEEDDGDDVDGCDTDGDGGSKRPIGCVRIFKEARRRRSVHLAKSEGTHARSQMLARLASRVKL